MITRGQLINDRYEIIRSIGEGGMANVYLAQDTILDRKVAVKILRGDLAEDEKFVRRFQREAISASSLNDPNIVEVYDVGEDDGKYFIVMEYVQGFTLKQLIKKRGSLTLPEVVDIMLQLTSAVAHAHESYIIHRDIKPQNVIILEDGRVKIMDFGIAVALNAGEFTQTNSVMGTVYYIPPEQANGGAATIKSDIYSLGILMYELVTGHVPFKGDNPVEVAIKHMNEPIPSICEYDPEMPQSIENIILRASAKNPRNRYESAWEMHEDLETALDKERFNEPKVVYKYPEKGFDDDDKPLPRGGRVARNAENEETKKDKRMNKALIILGTIVGVLIAALLFVFILWPRISSGSDVEIPDVQGMTVEQAQNALEDDGLEVEKKTKEEASDDVDEGKVIGTDPEIGESVKEGTKVTLIVSTGSEKIEIEDYTGEDVDDVKRELEDAGIRVVTEERDVASGDGVKENTIIDQDVEPGTKLGDGDTITLTIPNIYKTYPNFTDGTYTEDDVKKFCDENGITLNVTYIEDMTKSEGVVTYQNMGAGSRINSGDNLRIKVVKNPELQDATEPSDTGDM
ncbi:putative serine/threonine-specific protein kinase [Firmicutes bacterium CAG:822]|nr:putative serine/threonine-specific protein kinase [Firmicutes bacterium CAG:822]